MQTIEKALHQPMPFTTGGQTISDRLTAAKHSLAGSQLGKTICKATTEELMAPKKKHLDYLLHCTNEPNVSIPSMANLLIERTQHPSWTVVYKALITIHNIMCYGNERFSQYLASCNTTFNLGNFLDKNSTSGMRRDPSYSYQIEPTVGGWYPGYDMSQHVRRYGKYIGEKIATYRVCAFDFCKVKRGREDGLLRTMHTDKLLKTLPILQNQIDALLEFQVSSSELNNGVINCSFILLFRDLIRLFACYNDGIINLLEKYFDMNKKQCKDALDTYKGFLTRLDKVADFLRVAESVGIDRGEIPDLTRAPASLLEALEAHLIHLEGGRPPPPQAQFHAAQSQVNNFSIAGGFQAQPAVGDNERQRYIELEKERLRQFEEQKRQQGATTSQFNPFAAEAAVGAATTAEPKKHSDDLLDLFNAPAAQPAMDSTNPFAQFTAPAGPTAAAPGMYPPMSYNSSVLMPQQPPSSTSFSADFSTFTSNGTTSNGNGIVDTGDTNPFLVGSGVPTAAPPPPVPPAPHQWQPDFSVPPPAAAAAPVNPFAAGFGAPAETPVYANTSGEESPATVLTQPVVSSQPQTTAGAPSSAPMPVAQQQRLGIYEQTPFSHMDGSYTAPSAIPSHMLQGSSTEQSPIHQGYPGGGAGQPGGFDPFNTAASQQQKMSGDIDTALSSLAQNLDISGKPQPTSSVQWGGAPPARPPAPTTSAPTSVGQQPQTTMMYGGVPQYGAYGAQAYGAPQMQWGMQQPGMYGMQQQPMQPYAMYGNQPMGMTYNMQTMGQQQMPQAPASSVQQPKDPFSGF